MRERGLTVRDKVVVHLSGFTRFAEDYECPEEMCQSGISEGVGKSRAHVTLELNRMVRDGLVAERTARIRGARSKKKTYFLTAEGLARNSEIVRHLESLSVNVTGPDCKGPMSGTGAVAYLMESCGLSRAAAAEMVITSNGALVAPKKVSTDGIIFIPPRRELFVQRKELGELSALLAEECPNTVVLLGIPGSGKTSLMNELAWTVGGEMSVFYTRLYPYESVQNLLQRLGRFLGNAGLGTAADLMEAATAVSQCLRRHRFALLFDEYDSASKALDPLFGMLADSVCGSGSAMVVASSGKPGFYSVKNTVLDRSVREMRIGGLEPGEAMKLYRKSGGCGGEDGIKRAGGHPLLIKFLASGATSGTLMEYVEAEILGNDTKLARACRFASVLRRPFSADDMELRGVAPAQTIRKSLAFEAQASGGYMLHPAISGIINDAATETMLASLHAKAASYYVTVGTGAHEALYHLVRSGNLPQARIFVAGHGRELLDTGNPHELAEIMRTFIGPDDESPVLLEAAARVLDLAGSESALSYAMSLIEKSPDSPESQRAKVLCAKILAKRGRLKEGLDMLRGKAPFDSALAGEWHYARAVILRRTGRLKAALEECDAAEALFAKVGDRGQRAECWMEGAMVLSAMGKNEKAMARLSLAMPEFSELGRMRDLVICSTNAGIVLRELGRTEQALDSLETAAAKARMTGQSRLEVQALANLTEVLNLVGEHERAAALARQAADIFEKLGEPVMLAVCLFNLGTALAGLGRKTEAQKEFDAAVGLLKEHGMLKNRKRWILDAAGTLERIGRKKRAAEYRRMAK